MTANNAKPTPGPWAVGFSDGSGETYITAGDHAARKDIRGVVIVVGGCEDSYGIPQGVRNPADASLIAEAGTVYHETGLTPRQLEDQRAELLAALSEAERLIPELVRQIPMGAKIWVAATHDRIRAALARCKGTTS